MLGYLLLKIKNEKILIEKKLYDAQLQYFEKNDQKKLKDLYSYWKQLKSGMEQFKSRHPNLPEGISEGAFAIFFNSPRVIKVFGKTSGSFDNYDTKSHERIQVKATTIETDLTSFGPKSVWDVLYFLDFYRDGKFDGKFDVYKIPNKLIYGHQVSSTESFTQQQEQKRRPRFSIKGGIIRPEKIKPVKTCQL